MTGVLRRGEPSDVPVSVLLDDRRTTLPAIHAAARFDEGETSAVDGDFWLLDDPRNPIALRWRVGANALTVTKITSPGLARSPAIAQDLQRRGRAELYGIYFDTGSAAIRPESSPTIAAVASAMRAHSDWKLRIEGHTDNVGGAAFNLDLSRRRAEAVKAVLVREGGIAPSRLETAGFGASRPKDTNATVEGRARNRRVELARIR